MVKHTVLTALMASQLALFAAHANAAPAAANGPVLYDAQAGWPAGTYASPAFTPDGRTLFVTHPIDTPDGPRQTVMISHRQGAHWSAPQTAPFSGRWRDLETAVAPDGSYLIFASNRPATDNGKALDAFYGGKVRPARGGNLWRVDRVRDGWGTPRRLPDVVNANSSVFAPAVTPGGDLIFMQPDPKTSQFRLYRSAFTNRAYQTPEPLPFSDGIVADYDPAVSRDGAFIIFSSSRSPAPKDVGETALFMTFADRGGWSQPVMIDPVLLGIESRLSPDNTRLFYTTTRPTPASPPPGADQTTQQIWTITLSQRNFAHAPGHP